MQPIDRESPIPAYYQIAVDVRERIQRQEWLTGAQIPPEAELAKTYGVSRVTMRQALAELVKDGLLVRQRGSGTFVSQRPLPLVHDLSLPIALSGKLRQMGFTQASKTLQAATFDKPLEQVQSNLGIGANDRVAYLKRLMLFNGQPTSIDRCWFSEQMCPGMADEPLIEESVSKTLAMRYGLIPVRSEMSLEVVRAAEKDAALLKTFDDTPMILLTTVFYLEDGRPLEYSATTWLGDRVRFSLHGNVSSPMHDGDAPLLVSLKDHVVGQE